MKLSNYYSKAVIYPSIFILFYSIINSIINNFENEWQLARSLVLSSFFTSLIFSLLICSFSLTIFLNKINKLTNNFIWNILTWFFLPYAYITLVLIHDIRNRIKFDFGYGNDFLSLLVMTIPYVIGLCWTFIKFRQENTDYSLESTG